ncbi:hypothetical protein EJ110_NYTH28447 [Nymphaea thermarum]|nr:hypothetical protein EJ110_NYTH28447 [Nymphaea thermarum]
MEERYVASEHELTAFTAPLGHRLPSHEPSSFYLLLTITTSTIDATGVDYYIIALTSLASGTSWPDLAGERQVKEDWLSRLEADIPFAEELFGGNSNNNKYVIAHPTFTCKGNASPPHRLLWSSTILVLFIDIPMMLAKKSGLILQSSRELILDLGSILGRRNR